MYTGITVNNHIGILDGRDLDTRSAAHAESAGGIPATGQDMDISDAAGGKTPHTPGCSLVCKNGFAPWEVSREYQCIVANTEGGDDAAQQPVVGAENVPLLRNSLTGEKEPFVPHEGRKVKWYVCGPTVYDHAHLGHARAYLTFDIMRRIMEDYFGYEVFYQLNVTDIDDKIILKARRNKLLDEYLAERDREAGSGVEALLRDMDPVVEKQGPKLEARLGEARAAEVGYGKKFKSDKEKEEKVKEGEMKCRFFEVNMRRYAVLKKALQGGAAGTAVAVPKLGPDGEGEFVESIVEVVASRAAVLDVFGDELKEWLDASRGSDVTDNMVFQDHARKYERSFWEDLDALGVRRPDAVTRVTEYVEDIVRFVQKLIDTGIGYESRTGNPDVDGVYFDTQRFVSEKGHSYPKLRKAGEGISEADMAEGEGALGNLAGGAGKRHENDFAVWKTSKRGEPRWSSPWGDGRPGWHIECSVMASDLMGARLDVHGGGGDLRFPHHANEMAQSECYHGTHQWCNYWTHAGTLTIEGLRCRRASRTSRRSRRRWRATRRGGSCGCSSCCSSGTRR